MTSAYEYRTPADARAHDLDTEIHVGSRRPYEIDRILESVRVWYGTGDSDYEVLPRGMMTDGASVPWFFRRLFPTHTGTHWAPALMHDKYYGTGRVFMPMSDERLHGKAAKREADYRFYRAMLLYGTPRWRAWCMWKAVAWFGFAAWNKCRKEHP